MTYNKNDYTRFEKARIIGARALQISMGAPIMVELPVDIIDPLMIAQKEFDDGVIPITVSKTSENSAPSAEYLVKLQRQFKMIVGEWSGKSQFKKPLPKPAKN
jgi:DNA-directed RNA polymerase subunit K